LTPEAFVAHGPMTEQQGYIAALRMLNGAAGLPPTALVCGSTPLAAGALEAVLERGLKVPGDISIIAHDDDVPQLPAAGFSVPLTTTSSPLTEACAPLAALLLARIAGEAELDQLQRVATPQLVLRRSTGAARDGMAWA
jgi:LacI family transcriptional regulator